MKISQPFRAVITDLDGVVTRTAGLHARAWQKMFDEYLALRRRRGQTAGTQPFSDRDYRNYVDGKPRYAGAKSFLESRGIELPQGHPEDEAGKETVCGLGNRKNEYFQALLAKEGPRVDPKNIAQLRTWRGRGIKLALITSSRNGRKVLAAARLTDLFDVIVDGNDAAQAGLAGKPRPDLFLQAARRLSVAPEEAVVIEDALAGVQAGRAGNFGCVVGFSGDPTQAEALKRTGADRVIASFQELDSLLSSEAKVPEEIPSALKHWPKISSRLQGRRLAVFLDYDGTLTPIVPHPDQALLSSSMRKTLQTLASRHQVAVLSGRDLPDVQKKVGIENLIYAGSHGFDIRGPGTLQMQLEQGLESLPALENAERELRASLGSIPGILIERKRFAIAVHYRNVPESQIQLIESTVDEIQQRHPSLRKRGGKKIFELQPDVEWDKGKALLWLLQALNLDGPEVIPLYLGDDVTDEDAFQALAQRGIGIWVGEASGTTAAQYRLADVSEVECFLAKLAQH